MPAYFVERHGMKLSESSWFTGASYGGFAVVAIGAGWVADRLIQAGRDAVKVRRAFTIAGLSLASTQFIGALSDSNDVALFFAIFSLSCLGLTTANYWALTQTLIPGGPVGRIVGLQNFAANVPGIVAPILTGWLKETTGGYTGPMAAIGAFLVLGIFSYAVLVRPRFAPRASAAPA
jgi:dipeptide/tripeptide permease